MPELSAERSRLLELTEQSRTSLSALSAMIGRNPSYLQQFVRKGSPRKLEEADRRLLAEFFGIDERELRGDGIARRLNAAQDFVTVPRLRLGASAGPGSYSAEEISFDTFRFSRAWLREMGLEGADLSAIRVEGDSMEPVLRSGDEILVDRNNRGGEGIHVVRIGDALHVKQVQVGGSDRLKLISANAAYAPIDLSRDDVDIVGRVVWKSGRV